MIVSDQETAFKIIASMYSAAMNKVSIITNFTQDKGTCGYAFVRIPKDEVVLISALGGVSKIHASAGGYQALHHKEAVAQCMADTLKSHGVNATVDSWMD